MNKSMMGVIRFMKWLKVASPKLYGAILVTRPEVKAALSSQGLHAMGAINWDAITTGISDTIQKLIPVYQQKKILDTQLELAKKGQPMLSPEQISQSSTTGIQVKLSPEIEREVVATTQSARAGINWTTLALVGGGIFLLIQMSGRKRRGRR